MWYKKKKKETSYISVEALENVSKYSNYINCNNSYINTACKTKALHTWPCYSCVFNLIRMDEIFMWGSHLFIFFFYIEFRGYLCEPELNRVTEL